MKIRNKLTYLFIGIVAVLILILSLSIYFFSEDFREEEFYRRLESRAISTSRLLADVDEVDAKLLQIIEKTTPENLTSAKIIIIDFHNQIVFSTDEKEEIRITTGMINEIRLNERIKYKQEKYEIIGIIFVGKYDRFVAVSAAIDKYGMRKLQNLRLILMVGFISSIVLVSFGGWIFSGRAIAPISRVVKQVDNISESSLDLRLDEGNGKDEIALLNKTFNNMLDRLEIAFKMQKNFIANASHELRTPLTAITGQLEVILLKNRNKQEYKETIESVLDDIKNLNGISNRLLLLAQTSSDVPVTSLLPVRIDDILWQSRGELMKRNLDYKIEVIFDLSIEDENCMMVNCNEQLIKTALINLMENGCKYSEPHEVTVMLMGYKKEFLALEFKDRGIGIPKDDIPHIFEPFYRCSNSIKYKGHGIGLSLVERIVKLHNGRIEVETENQKGSLFRMLLPLIKKL